MGSTAARGEDRAGVRVGQARDHLHAEPGVVVGIRRRVGARAEQAGRRRGRRDRLDGASRGERATDAKLDMRARRDASARALSGARAVWRHPRVRRSRRVVMMSNIDRSGGMKLTQLRRLATPRHKA